MTMSLALQTLWIGTYPVAGQGSATGVGEGLWQTQLDTETGRLTPPRQVVQIAAPSFLAFGEDPRLMYAVNESLEGALTTLRLKDGGAEIIAEVSSGGAHPCHIVFDKALHSLVVVNFTSGTLSVIEVDSNGRPHLEGPRQVIELEGSGPVPDRQTSAHPHFVLPTPDGRHILVVDLGSDVIRRFDRDLIARRLVDDGAAVRMPRGSGPRHAAFSHDGRRLYVAGEFGAQLHTVEWDTANASGHVVASVPAYPSDLGNSELAHITVDGDKVLVGVRGADVLVEHRSDPDEGTTFQQAHHLPGSWPRHHAVIEDWTVVALQRSNRLAVLDRSGQLTDVVEVPSPACIVPANAESEDGSAA